MKMMITLSKPLPQGFIRIDSYEELEKNLIIYFLKNENSSPA